MEPLRKESGCADDVRGAGATCSDYTTRTKKRIQRLVDCMQTPLPQDTEATPVVTRTEVTVTSCSPRDWRGLRDLRKRPPHAVDQSFNSFLVLVF